MIEDNEKYLVNCSNTSIENTNAIINLKELLETTYQTTSKIQAEINEDNGFDAEIEAECNNIIYNLKEEFENNKRNINEIFDDSLIGIQKSLEEETNHYNSSDDDSKNNESIKERIIKINAILSKAEDARITHEYIKLNQMKTIGKLTNILNIFEECIHLFNISKKLSDVQTASKLNNDCNLSMSVKLKERNKELCIIREKLKGDLNVIRDAFKLINPKLVNLERKYTETQKRIAIYDQAIYDKVEYIIFLDNAIARKMKMLNDIQNNCFKSKSEISSRIRSLEIMEECKFAGCNSAHYYNPSLKLFNIYYIRSKNYKKFQARFLPYNHDSLQINTNIFVTGGFDPTQKKFSNITIMLEVINNYSIKNIQKANMITSKSHHKLVCINENTIYCLGGRNESQHCMSNCEIYNIKMDEWSTGPPMNQAKYSLAATSFDCIEIFAFGGFSDTPVNVVERLKLTEIYEWKYIKIKFTSWTAREEAAAIQISDTEILVFGGVKSHGEKTDESFIFDVQHETMKRTKGRMISKESDRRASCRERVYVLV